MKFRDPKTGEVFDSFERAHTTFCRNHECRDCALNNYKSLLDCVSFYKESCDEAARMIGYEVVEDHTGDATEKVLPHICEVLGGKDNPLEVDEEFNVRGYEEVGPFRINEGGYMVYECGDADMISDEAIYAAINHPESIIRKPRFTEEEVADMAAIQRLFRVTEVGRRKDGTLYAGHYNEDCAHSTNDPPVFYLPKELLLSLHPGQSVTLSEICGS